MTTPYRQPPVFPRIGRALPWRPLSLLAVALVSTLAWRRELYAHGWAGLDWVRYFHWAIPLGVALWIAWAVAAARVPSRRRRAALALALVAASAPMYFSVGIAANGVFHRFGGGIDALTTALWLLPPLMVIALGAAVGARTTWRLRAASLALWAGALPLGVLWLWGTAPEFADTLHAIKTGAAVPWLMISLGLPFLARGR